MSLIITLEHLATVPGFKPKPGFCRTGIRTWCAQNGVDWNRLRHHGLPAELLLAIGDPFALAVVEHAKQVEASHGR